MMICKADFEELFPEVFPSRQDTTGGYATMPQGAKCTARSDDSSDRTHTALQRRGVRANIPTIAEYVFPDSATDSAVVASMPAALALALAWTMLSNYRD